MLYFNCDYNEGAHEAVLKRLVETNMEQTSGYGCDDYCMMARKLIREKCKCEDAAVEFLVGGTQTNATVIKAALRPHQGVIAADTGHVSVHETGAIEAVGHKVLALKSSDGKISAKQIEECYLNHVNDEAYEHMVKPKMVYISQPTELGTIYSLDELTEISKVCRTNGLYLFVDGARLGYAMAAKGNDVTFEDMARLCDVFYIGGTKVGMLFGEAVVITKSELKEEFRYIMKQSGAMLAKGRLLGLQFLTMFENDLYIKVSKHADLMADKIRETLDKCNVEYWVNNTTNQIFPILEDSVLEKLRENIVYSYQLRIDEKRSAVRFCTSWATKEENVVKLCEDFEKILDQG